MIAAPTVNAVVLIMLIRLLPLYMVAAKIGLILIAVPLICRLLPHGQLDHPNGQPARCNPEFGAEFW